MLLGAALLPVTGAPLRAQPAVVEIEIRDFKYLPATVTVRAGTVVRWRNAEKRTPHTVRFASPDGVIESELLFPGDTWERRFDRPGTWDYLCGPHPEMRGSLVVKP